MANDDDDNGNEDKLGGDEETQEGRLKVTDREAEHQKT